MALERKIEAEDSTGVAAPAASGGGGSSAHVGKRFEVKKWNAVALWSWDIDIENCAICRNHIMELCTYAHTGPRNINARVVPFPA